VKAGQRLDQRSDVVVGEAGSERTVIALESFAARNSTIRLLLSG
jgi:hypothetical protein